MLLPQPAALGPYLLMPGAGLSFQYTFDPNSVVSGDPGVGNFRGNNASFGSVNAIYLSNTDGNGNNVGGLISSVLGNSLGTAIRPTGVLNHLVIRSLSNPTMYAMYLITGYTAGAGFTTVNLKKFSSLTPPSGITKDTVISFQLGGMPGGPVWAYDPTSVDTSTAPGQYTFKMNNAILANVTQVAIDGNTTNMGDWTSVWQSLNLAGGPIIARLCVVNQATVYKGSGTVKFGYYELNSFGDQGSWQQFNLTYVDSTGTGGAGDIMGLQNDPVLFAFQWVGTGAKLAPKSPVTTNTNALPNTLVPVDTTSGPVTVTLPTAPSDGCPILVKCVIRPGSNNVTVAAGGSDVFNKAGGSTTLTLNAVNQGVELQYDAADAIWYVTGSISS